MTKTLSEVCIVEIKNQLDKMRNLLTRYNTVKIEYFEKPFHNLEELSEERLIHLSNALGNFGDKEFKELYRIFRLPLQRVDDNDAGYVYWDRLFKNGRTSFTEMQLFREQSKECKSVWREMFKDILVKKKSIKTKGTSNGKETVKDNHQNPNQTAAQSISNEP